MMIKDIIKIERIIKSGFNCYDVFGLNLMDYNKRFSPGLKEIAHEPFAIFLKEMFKKEYIVLHVGSLGIKDIVEKK